MDACESCVCRNGEWNCRRKDCRVDDVDVSCAEGQRQIQRNGFCCPQCVSSQGKTCVFCAEVKVLYYTVVTNWKIYIPTQLKFVTIIFSAVLSYI